MINKLSVENENKVFTVYELKNPYSTGFAISEITGITSPDCDVSKSEFVTVDGGVIGNSRAKMRTITIKGYILDPVEKNRLKIYKQFPTKSKVDITIETDNRKGKISGVVNSVNFDNIFSTDGTEFPTVKITILCQESYFKTPSVSKLFIDSEVPSLMFPLYFPAAGVPIGTNSESGYGDIINTGDIACGCVITITLNKTISSNIVIFNETRNEKFTINTPQGFVPGDVIKISSIRGKKYIKLNRDGYEISLLSFMDPTSSWIRLSPGLNSIIFTGDSCSFELEADNYYEGM